MQKREMKKFLLLTAGGLVEGPKEGGAAVDRAVARVEGTVCLGLMEDISALNTGLYR